MIYPRPKMSLRCRYVYNESIIISNSPEADALFELMKKKTMKPSELHWIWKMGFEVCIGGEIKELVRDMNRMGQPIGLATRVSNGVVEYIEHE